MRVLLPLRAPGTDHPDAKRRIDSQGSAAVDGTSGLQGNHPRRRRTHGEFLLPFVLPSAHKGNVRGQGMHRAGPMPASACGSRAVSEPFTQTQDVAGGPEGIRSFRIAVRLYPSRQIPGKNRSGTLQTPCERPAESGSGARFAKSDRDHGETGYFGLPEIQGAVLPDVGIARNASVPGPVSHVEPSGVRPRRRNRAGPVRQGNGVHARTGAGFHADSRKPLDVHILYGRRSEKRDEGHGREGRP